ncbi:MAG TPA: N-acetyltransferase [Kiloniellales bacterium]|jgi:putative acetyltransferase|nr:N-acetyltransferase [Kiloniellales bacterium]
MSVGIHPETAEDIAAIEAVTVAAFQDAPHASGTEHLIVRALRNAGQLTISLVADDRGDLVGHLAISPVTISDGATGWYGLGPLSVAPKRQRQGIGTRLIQDALEHLRPLGAAGLVVLGEPGYYGRFGFRAAQSLVLPGVPSEYFQSLRFKGREPSGTVSYHRSFTASA